MKLVNRSEMKLSQNQEKFLKDSTMSLKRILRNLENEKAELELSIFKLKEEKLSQIRDMKMVNQIPLFKAFLKIDFSDFV